MVTAWFTGSPTPGARGPAVIEGHIDGTYGPSDFFKLGAVHPGDTVAVHRADGHTAHFRVYRAERYAKKDFPTGAVYGNTSGGELRLITCGGNLNPHTGHHLDNTVIYARLTRS